MSALLSHRLPLNSLQVADEFFIENRTRVLDIAAFLDRLDRADETGGASGADFRVLAFRDALKALVESDGPRIQAVQTIFSDPTTKPLESLDQKSARGAYQARNGHK